MQWSTSNKPSMSHDYHTQLVSKILHFMNLDKSSHLVYFIQILHHIRFIAIEQKY